MVQGARLALWDLLKAVTMSAARVSKWMVECDRALHRLICYRDTTKDMVLTGFVGDDIKDCCLRLYADADFAGDRPGYRSTPGAFLCIVGPHTFFPLASKSAKQTCVSYSTPEAELVSANAAVRILGIPALELWETVLGRSFLLEFLEDNQSTIQIIKTGKNPTLRHVSRTHGVNAAWLYDVYEAGNFTMRYEVSDEMVAGIFTKAFKELPQWQHAVNLIGMGVRTGGGNILVRLGSPASEKAQAEKEERERRRSHDQV